MVKWAGPGGLKKRLREIGRKAFITALPLLAASCAKIAEPHIPDPALDSCHSYNESTVTVNYEGDAGPLPGVEELRRPDGFLGEGLAHALRASHGISTLGLPGGFLTRVTLLDEGCFRDGETGGLSAAYALTPYHRDDYSGAYGVYTRHPELTLYDFSLLSHEIGHLQAPHGEVQAEANATEQMLMLAEAYAREPASEADRLLWAAQSVNSLFGLEELRAALVQIYDEGSRLDPDPAASMRMHPQGRYIEADIYLLDAFGRHRGDFASLRSEIASLGREGLEEAIPSRVRDFISSRSGSDAMRELAGLVAEIRIAHLSELGRRFGEEAARSYFDAHSHVAHWSEERGRFVMVLGLQGMDCMLAAPAQASEDIPCDAGCSGFGAARAVRFEGAEFHCVEAVDGTLQYRRFDAAAGGFRYLGDGTARLDANGVACDEVMVVDGFE
ncbi:MAG: hypothetical protein AB1324_02305 [Candidatus Micrarchaeota archaeon]